jgi:hypothetical protein
MSEAATLLPLYVFIGGHKKHYLYLYLYTYFYSFSVQVYKITLKQK